MIMLVFVGVNDIGMVAWHCQMKTPEYPEGRELVIIASDVTFQSGSFGVEEDEFFAAASRYARQRGIPRIYLSSNSGARIGHVEELKPMLQVCLDILSILVFRKLTHSCLILPCFIDVKVSESCLSFKQLVRCELCKGVST